MSQQFAGTIVGLQIILLLAALDQTIITTAMPRIVAELGGFERYAAATTSYLFASTIAVPSLRDSPIATAESHCYWQESTYSSPLLFFVDALGCYP